MTKPDLGAKLAAAEAEIDRAYDAIRRANAQAEHFEREWYLRGDEIERLRADRSLLLNGMRGAVTALAAAAENDEQFDLDYQVLDKLLARFADDAAMGEE